MRKSQRHRHTGALSTEVTCGLGAMTALAERRAAPGLSGTSVAF